MTVLPRARRLTTAKTCSTRDRIFDLLRFFAFVTSSTSPPALRARSFALMKTIYALTGLLNAVFCYRLWALLVFCRSR